MEDTELEALRRRMDRLRQILDAQGPWLVTLYDRRASGGDRQVTREDVAQAMILLHDLRGLYSALSGDVTLADRRRKANESSSLPDFDPMPNR